MRAGHTPPSFHFYLREFPSAEIEKDFSTFRTHRIGAEVDTHGRTLGFSRAVVKAAIVLGALDDVVHDETVGQMNFFVGAEPISRVELVIRRSVYRERTIGVIKAPDVFQGDVIDTTYLNPIPHHKIPFLSWLKYF